MHFVLAVLLLVGGCATTKAAEPKHTLPPPLVAAKLPERPDAKSIPVSADWVIAVEEGETVPEGRAGVLMSQEKAVRAAEYVVAYNELRQLYVVDLTTWGRERQIYERYLEAADGEVDHWKKQAERSWWEKHSGQIGLGAGLIVGAVITVAIVEAVQQVEK